VRGFHGGGKSFALYVLVLHFRLRRDQKYRVTYIPDCGEWKKARWEYLRRPLAATFQHDVIQGGKAHLRPVQGGRRRSFQVVLAL